MHAHCYRMLGSLHDADDASQEALLRAWRGVGRFEGKSAFGSWLYRIATNACLDALAYRARRVLPVDYGPESAPGRQSAPLADRVWIEPYPDGELGIEDCHAGPEARYEQREAVELAFIAALQHLPPRQRAALILRDVLGFSAREVAEALGSTVPSVNSALHRARSSLEARLPSQSQQANLRSLGDGAARELVMRFTDAFERGDVDEILAMFADDVVFSMPPYPDWCRGRAAVAESWLMPGGPPPRLRYAATSVNAQLAVGTYQVDESSYAPIAIDVLTIRRTEITEVVAFRSPELFGRFGLPSAL